MQSFDAIVIGAGAAGLLCAAMAGQRGLKVLLIDHSHKVAEKIRISGGGRCNFTNREVTHLNFLSANPDFCRSALARYTPQDFIDLVRHHGIAFHEKHRGQLFCDGSSDQIIRMLVDEAAAGRVDRRQPVAAHAIRKTGEGFEIECDAGTMQARSLVIATGGLSVPKIGATDFGYRTARQFGHTLVEPRPALVPLTFGAQAWASFAELAGLSLEVSVRATQPHSNVADAKQVEFTEDLLFTHRGLSGPAVLQISSYWEPGTELAFDLTPGRDLPAELRAAKKTSQRRLAGVLAQTLPGRLAQRWLDHSGLDGDRPISECRDRDLDQLSSALGQWRLTPTGTEGWKKAEVTAGGVDTRELDSRRMESRRVRGLYFIGEVVDVTGWLGGYNFQWAWASAAACSAALASLPDSKTR